MSLAYVRKLHSAGELYDGAEVEPWTNISAPVDAIGERIHPDRFRLLTGVARGELAAVLPIKNQTAARWIAERTWPIAGTAFHADLAADCNAWCERNGLEAIDQRS